MTVSKGKEADETKCLWLYTPKIVCVCVYETLPTREIHILYEGGQGCYNYMDGMCEREKLAKTI